MDNEQRCGLEKEYTKPQLEGSVSACVISTENLAYSPGPGAAIIPVSAHFYLKRKVQKVKAHRYCREVTDQKFEQACVCVCVCFYGPLKRVFFQSLVIKIQFFTYQTFFYLATLFLSFVLY